MCLFRKMKNKLATRYLYSKESKITAPTFVGKQKRVEKRKERCSSWLFDLLGLTDPQPNLIGQKSPNFLQS